MHNHHLQYRYHDLPVHLWQSPGIIIIATANYNYAGVLILVYTSVTLSMLIDRHGPWAYSTSDFSARWIHRKQIAIFTNRDRQQGTTGANGYIVGLPHSSPCKCGLRRSLGDWLKSHCTPPAIQRDRRCCQREGMWHWHLSECRQHTEHQWHLLPASRWLWQPPQSRVVSWWGRRMS